MIADGCRHGALPRKQPPSAMRYQEYTTCSISFKEPRRYTPAQRFINMENPTGSSCSHSNRRTAPSSLYGGFCLSPLHHAPAGLQPPTTHGCSMPHSQHSNTLPTPILPISPLQRQHPNVQYQGLSAPHILHALHRDTMKPITTIRHRIAMLYYRASSMYTT